MTDTTPTEFAHVDPATLVLGANARLDADLTPEFIASIKQHGVLQTIDAHRNTDGALVVLRGQRRTLAAVQVRRSKTGRVESAEAGSPGRRASERSPPPGVSSIA